MNIRAGTSGYSYKEWSGVFYPEDLKNDQWLTYYASQLSAVEINNTFYRMPKAHVVEAWRDAVPEDFRFVLKASRRITHQGRLKNVNQATGYLVERLELLGDRLGAVLFQLPPNMSADVDRLKAFQELLPNELPVAFEFRHPSWDCAEVTDALNERGHSQVISHDGGHADPAQAGRVGTAKLIYLRLRAEHYGKRDLQRWVGQIHKAAADEALVFFKHEDAGAGPKLAAEFRQLADRLTQKPAPKRAAKTKPRSKKPNKKTQS